MTRDERPEVRVVEELAELWRTCSGTSPGSSCDWGNFLLWSCNFFSSGSVVGGGGSDTWVEKTRRVWACVGPGISTGGFLLQPYKAPLFCRLPDVSTVVKSSGIAASSPRKAPASAPASGEAPMPFAILLLRRLLKDVKDRVTALDGRLEWPARNPATRLTAFRVGSESGSWFSSSIVPGVSSTPVWFCLLPERAGSDVLLTPPTGVAHGCVPAASLAACSAFSARATCLSSSLPAAFGVSFRFTWLSLASCASLGGFGTIFPISPGLRVLGMTFPSPAFAPDDCSEDGDGLAWPLRGAAAPAFRWCTPVAPNPMKSSSWLKNRFSSI